MPKKPRKYGSRTKRLSVKVTEPIDAALRRRASIEGVGISDVVVGVLERELKPKRPAKPVGDGVFG